MRTMQREQSANELRTVNTEDDIQGVLGALDDVDCRAIIKAISDTALSAHELSKSCNIPLSTTYRKLDVLTEAGLLEEGTRIRLSGKHTSEYSWNIEEVVISVSTNEGIELQVKPRKPPEHYPVSLTVQG